VPATTASRRVISPATAPMLPPEQVQVALVLVLVLVLVQVQAQARAVASPVLASTAATPAIWPVIAVSKRPLWSLECSAWMCGEK